MPRRSAHRMHSEDVEVEEGVFESKELEVDVKDEHVAPICETCKGTGAVPHTIIAGVVDRWMNCPDCVPCPAKCDNGKIHTFRAPAESGTDCPVCYKGRVPKDFVLTVK